MTDKKIVLLTGGSSRLGRVIARHLAETGHTVYCTSRKAASSDMKGRIHFIKLDVTSDADVRRGIAAILAKEKRIDVVINNAAVTITGLAIDFSAEDFKTLLDTNVVGAFRVIKSSYSFPQKPKVIINITSLNGFLAVPNFGLYSASKFAIEALGQSLRYELTPSTRVINVAPGALQVEPGKKMPHKPAREKIPLLNWLLPLTTLDDVAVVIENVMNSESPPARVLVGRDAKIINFLQKVLPSFLFERIIFFIWQKK